MAARLYPFALGAPVLFALMASAGCSNTVEVSPTSAGSSSTVALLSVERSAAAGESTVVPRAHASAYFMRLPAGTDSNLAARLVGAALALPPIDQCESADSVWNRGLPLASLEPVDLVDVGQVAIEAGRTTETMAARAFPDVIDLVSGVVYTSRDQVADPLPDGERYVFRISGSPAFPRVAFSATAPSPPTEVVVGGTPLESATITVARQDLTLRWRPNGGDSVIYVDIVPNDDAAVARLRCAFADDGDATVPLAMLPNGTTQTISIHRVVRAPAQARDWDTDQALGEAGALNLDGGEIRFDLAATGGLRFETAAP